MNLLSQIFTFFVLFTSINANADEIPQDNLFTHEAKLKKEGKKPPKSNKTAASKKWMDGRIPENKKDYQPLPESEQSKRIKERSTDIPPEMRDPVTGLIKPVN